MTEDRKIPKFCVIGAAKAGTTWLQSQLQANPAIYMPDPEPHFFSRKYHDGMASYREWFAPAIASDRILGEKSADYLSHPEAPARLALANPGARLVVQLRNPVERAYSDFKMYFRRGLVGKRPEDYLSSLDNPYPRFLFDGLYGKHLSCWLEHFPREQIFVFLFEELKLRPRAITEEVSRHIGVPPIFDERLAERAENDSKARLLPLGLRNALAPLKESVKPLRGNRVFENVRSLLAKEVAYPALSKELRRKLQDFYAKDILLAEELLGLDLGHWKAADMAATA